MQRDIFGDPYYKGSYRDPYLWYKKAERSYEKEILRSTKESTIYKDQINPMYTESNFPTITVADIDSVDAVFKYANETEKTALLNFASFVEPGGGFMRGAIAQEEAICHESDLYNVLSRFEDYYADNAADMNNFWFYDRGIYSPDIVFVSSEDGSTKKADVITVAAPIYEPMLVAVDDTFNQYSETLERRIKYVLDMAQDQKVDTLILGAFGCGEFGNKPTEVSYFFMKHLTSGKYSFKKVIFAIPRGHGERNYNVFKSVFEGGNEKV